MPLFNFRAAEAVTVKLKCDPAPDGEKAVFEILPLTPDIVDEAAIRAGRVPWLGRKLVNQVAAAIEAAGAACLKASGLTLKDLQGDAVARMAWHRAREAAEFEAMAALTDEDEALVVEARRWVERHTLETAAAVVVSVNGEPADYLDLVGKIRPASLASEVTAEILAIAREVAELGDEGKGVFAARYGRSTTPTEPDGGALTATPPTLPTAPEGGAAAP